MTETSDRPKHIGCLAPQGKACYFCDNWHRFTEAQRRNFTMTPEERRRSSSGFRQPQSPHSAGVGTDLKLLLQSFKITPSAHCGCHEMEMRMNLWGPEGCRKNRGEIEQ